MESQLGSRNNNLDAKGANMSGVEILRKLSKFVRGTGFRKHDSLGCAMFDVAEAISYRQTAELLLLCLHPFRDC